MSGWERSDRRSRLPPNWEEIRLEVMKRDGWRCRHENVYGERCKDRAVDVDHIANNDDHRLKNLRAICEWHHDGKTLREARAAQVRAIYRNKQRFLRTEAHPGLL